MKVLIINQSDSTGGAAIAAMRLYSALKLQNIDTQFLSLYGNKAEHIIANTKIKQKAAFLRFTLSRAWLLPYVKNKRLVFSFDNALFGTPLAKHKALQQPDILHLHWTNAAFLSLKNLDRIFALGKPVVWTLHDMWTFTGGCHYSYDCKKFENHCNNCSLYLKSPSNNDLSHKIFDKKISLFSKYQNITFVTCSNWLKTQAENSFLLKNFRIEHINNPIDTEVFKPIDKEQARKELNIKSDKKIILFTAMNIADKRKGFEYLKQALEIIKNTAYSRQIELLIVGKASPEMLDALPLAYHYIPFTKSISQMIKIYNSADVFVIPSLQDNLPNTIVEANACGVPVAGFDNAGVSEMIEHKKTGYLAEYKNVSDLAKGILHILFETTEKMHQNARQLAVERYNQNLIASKYAELYKSVLKLT